jgi:hypothetical protein
MGDIDWILVYSRSRFVNANRSKNCENSVYFSLRSIQIDFIEYRNLFKVKKLSWRV